MAQNPQNTKNKELLQISYAQNPLNSEIVCVNDAYVYFARN